MECDQCGLPLLGTEEYCPQCGARLERKTSGKAKAGADEPAGRPGTTPPAEQKTERSRASKDRKVIRTPEEAPAQPDAVEVPLPEAGDETDSGGKAKEAVAPHALEVPLEDHSGEREPEQLEVPLAPADEVVDVPLEAELSAVEPTGTSHRAPATVPPSQAAPRVSSRPRRAASGPPAGSTVTRRLADRRRNALIGPLGLGIAAGCLFLFILALGGLGVVQGRQIRQERQKQEAAVHYERGLDYMQLGDYELAVAEFEYALRLNQNYLEAQQKLAEARAKASPQPTPVSSESQESSGLWASGQAAYERGDWDEAIGRLEALQAADPAYEQTAVRRLLAGAYTNSGLKLVNEDRLEEAIRRFDQALAVEPGNPDIQLQSRLATLYQGGLTAWGVEDWREAIKSLAAVYALKPDYKDIGERLPKAYAQAGDAAGEVSAWCEAVEYYKLALDLSSSSDVAAKRDDAAHRCASSPDESGGTPVPSGTYAGVYAGLVDNRQRTSKWAEVRGHVLDASGRGVPNVGVQLSAFDWTSNIQTTDATGYYSIEFLSNEITFTVTLVGVPVQPVDVPTKFGYASVADFQQRQ
jgi:tetratricopeptide (TPR) repeat protein/uncharacterized Zn finger protein (UPF0148 family)